MQCAFDVVVEIGQRSANRNFNAFESGKMDDGLDWIFAEQPFDCRWVSKIAVLEGDRPATNRFHASEGFNVAVNKVVEYDNGVSGIQQFKTDMRTDISCASGHQDHGESL